MEDLNRRLMNSLRLTYNLLRRRRLQGILLEGSEEQEDRTRQPWTRGAADMEKKQLLKMKEERSALRQEMILEAICQAGSPLSQKNLATQLSMPSQGLTEELNKLERRGYVTRSRSKDGQSVSLTKRGQERAEELRQIKNRQNEEFFKPLTEEEKETLLTLLDKLNMAEEMGLKDGSI